MEFYVKEALCVLLFLELEVEICIIECRRLSSFLLIWRLLSEYTTCAYSVGFICLRSFVCGCTGAGKEVRGGMWKDAKVHPSNFLIKCGAWTILWYPRPPAVHWDSIRYICWLSDRFATVFFDPDFLAHPRRSSYHFSVELRHETTVLYDGRCAAEYRR